jgi:hypothetical protein
MLVKTLRKKELYETLFFQTARGKMLSYKALTAFLPRVEATSDTRESIAPATERALAQTVANRGEAAYHRTDLLEQCRPLMEARTALFWHIG